MPKYDYRCPQCDVQREVEYPISEIREVRCETCDLEMFKIFTAPVITFKGKGWGHQ